VSTSRSIQLPKLLQLEWCSRGFGDLPWAAEPVPDERVRVMAEGPVEYVDPVASAMLAAWAARWRSKGGLVDVDDSAKSPYAYRLGLLGALAGKTLDEATTDRVVPVVAVQEDRKNNLLARIRPLLHLDPDTTQAVAYCLAELMTNVFEHAARDAIAYVAASYFPKTDRVTIAVADVGKTIPRDIRDRYERERGELNDLAAFRAALEPHTSGATADPRNNAGLGLYMTRRLAQVTGGKFWLVSAGCRARDDIDATALSSGEILVEPLANPWPGTVVAVTLHPRTFNYDATMSALRGERTDPFSLRFSKKVVPERFALVATRPDVANMAQDKTIAMDVRRAILEALRTSPGVAISLSGIALTTQSYVHALLAEVFEVVGPSAAAERLVFVGCAPQVQTIIRLVARYVFERMEAQR
jgi:anti-sigma regulatory factor (Ser/Thr protein kinase)